MDRFREQSVNVINPFNNKVSTVSLVAEDVVAIVFWTKNAAPLTRYLDDLSDSGYRFTFLYTINNYPKLVEPEVPDIDLTMKTVEHLFKKYGQSVLRWRYDTIVLADTLDRFGIKEISQNCVTLWDRLLINVYSAFVITIKRPERK